MLDDLIYGLLKRPEIQAECILCDFKHIGEMYWTRLSNMAEVLQGTSKTYERLQTGGAYLWKSALRGIESGLLSLTATDEKLYCTLQSALLEKNALCAKP